MALKNPHNIRHRKVRLNPSLPDYMFIETHSADSPVMQDPSRSYGDPHKDTTRYPDHALVYVGAERIEKDGRKVVDFYYAAIGDNQDDYNFEIVNGEYLRRTYLIPRDLYYSRHEDDAQVAGEFTYPDAGEASPDTRFSMYAFMDDTLSRSNTELDGKYVTIQRRFVRPKEESCRYNDTFKKNIKTTKEVIPHTDECVQNTTPGTLVEIQDGNLFHSIKVTQELQLGGVDLPYQINSIPGTQNFRFPSKLERVDLQWAWAWASSTSNRDSYSQDFYYDYKITIPKAGPYSVTIDRYITDESGIAGLKASNPITHIPQPVKESISVVGAWFTASVQKGNATSATAKEIAVPATIHDLIDVRLFSNGAYGGVVGNQYINRNQTLDPTSGYDAFMEHIDQEPIIIDYNLKEIGLNLYEFSVVKLDASGVYVDPDYDVNAIPSPDPMTFSSAPQAISDTEIEMTATAASHVNGVEYYFESTSGGGNDSGWQTDREYTDTGLTASTTYGYKVKARDKVEQNTTGLSAEQTATTDAP